MHQIRPLRFPRNLRENKPNAPWRPIYGQKYYLTADRSFMLVKQGRQWKAYLYAVQAENQSLITELRADGFFETEFERLSDIIKALEEYQ